MKAHVPPERLLVFDVREGWQPLCSFLQLPVPDFPFPNVNDTATMRRTSSMICGMCWVILAAVPVVLACLLPRCETLVETFLSIFFVFGSLPAMGRIILFWIKKHGTTKQ